MFQFMVHDRWSNALFLHWRLPSHLEPVLEKHVSPFQLDRTPGDGDGDGDGSAWIGLILLTEQNVGPPIWRRKKWTTVTHHGVNVRTYVKGPADDVGAVGIHFASLECDDVVTSFGANLFGMPYKVASIERTFFEAKNSDMLTGTCKGDGQGKRDDKREGRDYDDGNGNDNGVTNEASNSEVDGGEQRVLLEKGMLSTPEIDDLLCSDDGELLNGCIHSLTLRSIRAKKSSPTLLNMIRLLVSFLLGSVRNMLLFRRRGGQQRLFAREGPVHSTKLKSTSSLITDTEDDPALSSDVVPEDADEGGLNNNNNNNNNNFSVEAQWERQPNNKNNNNKNNNPLPNNNNINVDLAHFFFERYHVYTHKYGLNWQGTVHHEPWPIETAVLKKLVIKNIDVDYEPKEMRPILKYMASNEPDSVLFSRGVGPIHFDMLRPV